MSQICRFDRPAQARAAYFTRAEMNLLLALYTRRVAAGEWRDYAIGEAPAGAVFAVFRSAQERPLFTITKLAGAGYVVASRGCKLRQAGTLSEALAVFRSLHLVAT